MNSGAPALERITDQKAMGRVTSAEAWVANADYRMRTSGTRPDHSLVVVKRAPFNAEAPLSALRAPITPTPQIYVRSNFAVPELSAEHHRVLITGAVQNQLEISVAELRGMRDSLATVTMTMECAGNDRLTIRPLPRGEPWESGAVSTSRWTGVPLRHLLDRAELDEKVVEILVHGADSGDAQKAGASGFARSLPIATALDPDTLLAFAVNDVPLPPEHGAPIRLVVPGWYGMASVKWVTRISALLEPYDGYFQRDRYVYAEPGRNPVPVSRMRVKSLIVSPTPTATLSRGHHVIRGFAWSGEGAITRVEVSDGGDEVWRDAQLSPAPSAHAWTQWFLDWEPPDVGRYVLRSRATDSAGNAQPDEIRWNRLGYGNNAIQTVVIHIA